MELLFLPDGTLVIGDGKGGVSHWNTMTGENIIELAAHVGRIEGLALSGDGRTLATCGADCAVRLWNTHNLRDLFQLFQANDRIGSLAFRSNGDLTFTTQKGTRPWSYPGAPAAAAASEFSAAP